MIYNDKEEYKIRSFVNPINGISSVNEYIKRLAEKDRGKVLKYINYLADSRGILDEPYTRHITGKIRELRVDFGRNRHRIFFFTFINKNIILLHAFLKRTQKTPQSEIDKAQANYFMVINNRDHYEEKIP